MTQRRVLPVVTRYFFCCELRIGICIHAVVILFVNSLIIWHDFLVMMDMVQLCPNAGWRDDNSNVCHTLNINFAIHYVFYVGVQIVYILSILILFYGIITKKTVVLKVFIRFNEPRWVYMTILAALNVFMQKSYIRILVLFFSLIDGYHILAVRSSYSMLTGKSKFYKETDSELTTVVNQDTGSNGPPAYNEVCLRTMSRHCDTCTCGQDNQVGSGHSPASDDSAGPTPGPASGAAAQGSIPGLARAPLDLPLKGVFHINITKEINIAPRDLILNPYNVHANCTTVIEDVQITAQRGSGQEALRTDSKEGTNSRKEKMNIDDQPTIFDQSQLDVGTRDSDQEASRTEFKEGTKSRKEKMNIDDLPTIFDQSQLDVGTSPILENVSFARDLSDIK